MTTHPIVALESLGYTKREAAFLYLVAVHSGYFIRRQFDYFIDRVAGAIAQNFVEKARIAGHVEILDYSNGYRVYHLFAKPIYRLLENPESQNRRRKGDGAIRARLISLDYVLENENDRYLESEEERFHFFSEERRIPQRLYTDATGRMHPLLGSSPIALVDAANPGTSIVRFLFADEGLLTIEKFKRYLSLADPLLRAVGNFELVYASASNHNFVAAQHEYRRHFPTRGNGIASQLTLNENWRNNSSKPVQNYPALRAQFSTFLIRFSYPQLRRNERASLSASRPSKLVPTTETIHEQVPSNDTGSRSG